MRCQLLSKPSFEIHARQGDREMPAHRNFTEQGPGYRYLRDVADSKRREPRLRLWKSLNQIRTAERRGDDRLARFIKLLRQRRLLRRHVDVSLALAHAHKHLESRNLIRIRRRPFPS